MLVPVAFLVAYEAGVGRLPLGAGAASRRCRGGRADRARARAAAARTRRSRCPRPSSRQLLVPAAIALVLRLRRERRAGGGSRRVAAASLALALVHPTYALFLLVPLGRLRRRALRAGARTELAQRRRRARRARRSRRRPFAAWLRPIVRDTASVEPVAPPSAHAGSRTTRASSTSSRPDSFRLAPEVLGRTGAVAVAALVAVPLAALAVAPALGGVRARRLARRARATARAVALHALLGRGVALAGAAARRLRPVRVRLRRRAAVLARLRRAAGRRRSALAAGIALQLAYPGDFGYALDEGGPAVATWIARRRGARRRRSSSGSGALRAASSRDGRARRARFVLLRRLHGFAHWDLAPRGRRPAHRRASSSRSQARARGRGRLLATRDELPDRRGRAGLRRDSAARATSPTRRRTGRTSARDDAALRRTGDLAIPRATAPTGSLVDRDRCAPGSICRRCRASAGPLYRLLTAVSTIAAVKVLIVSFYFPPAGGGGVQRPLKLAQYLPALGIETHVLAPDDPQWVHRDDELQCRRRRGCTARATSASGGGKPAEELPARRGSSGATDAGAAPAAPPRRARTRTRPGR